MLLLPRTVNCLIFYAGKTKPWRPECLMSKMDFWCRFAAEFVFVRDTIVVVVVWLFCEAAKPGYLL
jgi:hypothetical protein